MIFNTIHHSMRDTFSDEYGFLDFQRSQHGSGMSQKNQAKKFISELSRMADHTNSSTFTWSQLKDITKVSLKKEHPFSFEAPSTFILAFFVLAYWTSSKKL